MTTNKKKFEEKLSDVRHHQHNKIRYLKRIQEEREADEELKEQLKHFNEDSETDGYPD